MVDYGGYICWSYKLDRLSYITIQTGDNLEKICHSLSYNNIKYSAINDTNIPSDLPSECSSVFGVVYLFNTGRFVILFLNTNGQLFSKMSSGFYDEFNPWYKIGH